MSLDLRREIDQTNDRYHRQGLIEWWDQKVVRDAKVLVVGAGALGNEILKLLTLIGVGQVLVFDMDRIEHSNLSSSAPVCGNNHWLCPDCSVACETCAQPLCLACGVTACPRCTSTCGNCSASVRQGLTCSAAHQLCGDCAMNCQGCSEVLCLLCGTFPCPSCTPGAQEAPSPVG